MKYSNKIVIGILILLTLIIVGFLAFKYFTQEKEPFADVQEITEDEAIELAKDCKITHGTYVTQTTKIYLNNGTERKLQGTRRFSETLYGLESKCGEVPILIYD